MGETPMVRGCNRITGYEPVIHELVAHATSINRHHPSLFPDTTTRADSPASLNPSP
jgi:hypothetical protein